LRLILLNFKHIKMEQRKSYKTPECELMVLYYDEDIFVNGSTRNQTESEGSWVMESDDDYEMSEF